MFNDRQNHLSFSTRFFERKNELYNYGNETTSHKMNHRNFGEKTDVPKLNLREIKYNNSPLGSLGYQRMIESPPSPTIEEFESFSSSAGYDDPEMDSIFSRIPDFNFESEFPSLSLLAPRKLEKNTIATKRTQVEGKSHKEEKTATKSRREKVIIEEKKSAPAKKKIVIDTGQKEKKRGKVSKEQKVFSYQLRPCRMKGIEYSPKNKVPKSLSKEPFVYSMKFTHNEVFQTTDYKFKLYGTESERVVKGGMSSLLTKTIENKDETITDFYNLQFGVTSHQERSMFKLRFYRKNFNGRTGLISSSSSFQLTARRTEKEKTFWNKYSFGHTKRRTKNYLDDSEDSDGPISSEEETIVGKKRIPRRSPRLSAKRQNKDNF